MKKAACGLLAALLALTGCTGQEGALPTAAPTNTPSAAQSTPTPTPVKKRVAQRGDFELDGPVLVVGDMPTEDVEPGENVLYSDRTYQRETVLSGEIYLVEDRLQKADPGLGGLHGAIEKLEGECLDMELTRDDEASDRTGLDCFRMVYLTDKDGMSYRNTDLYLQAENWDFRFHVAVPAKEYSDYADLVTFWISSVEVIEDSRIGWGNSSPETPVDEAPPEDQDALQEMSMIMNFAAGGVCDTEFRAYPRGSQPDSDLVWLVLAEYAQVLSGFEIYPKEEGRVYLTHEEMAALYDRCFGSGKLPKVPSSLRASGAVAQTEQGYTLAPMNRINYVTSFSPISYSVSEAGDYLISGSFMSGYSGDEQRLWRQGNITLHRNEGDEMPLYRIISINTNY
ncbi:Uncharacterised protein [uncultured Clostridium sp.]|nr:Uncharacterised protein [uncultured Clostridium sp.]